MRDKTFADYLIRHDVKLPVDTVVININDVVNRAWEYSEKHPDETITYPQAFGVSFDNIYPIFENMLVEISLDNGAAIACSSEEGGDEIEVKVYLSKNYGLDLIPLRATISIDSYPPTVKLYNNNKDIEGLKEWMAFFANIICAAMALIHNKQSCDLIAHSRQVKRSVKRKTGKEPSPYFMLKIEPVKEQGQYTPSGNKSGRKLPQHIVRGHFRHVADHPLKQLNGTFWIAAHMRGDRTRGQVVKGYTIVLPER